MIQAQNVTKSFCSASQPAPHIALNNLSCTIPGGCIYGLVGSNGAGKSTFLRLLSGVYRPDEGLIEIDGLPVWENPEAKARIREAAAEKLPILEELVAELALADVPKGDVLATVCAVYARAGKGNTPEKPDPTQEGGKLS